MGVDLVSVDRMSRLAAESPDILATLFTEGELALFGDARRFERMAGRFAAKEALLKAFGFGLLAAIELVDIEIVRTPAGRPRPRLYGAAAAWAETNNLVDADVSISHTGGLAVAHALVVCRPPAQSAAA